MSLSVWMIAWAAVTTVVVVLAYLRLMLGMHDIMGARFGSAGQAEFYDAQRKITRRLSRLDMVGIPLTILSALLLVVVILLAAIESGGTGAF